MAFPQDRRDIIGEMFLDGGWRDVTSDIRGSSGIGISRGRRDASSRSQAGVCAYTLDDRLGDYAPENPLGQWYGYIGNSTPVRIGIGKARDTFTRALSNSWGTSDTGQAWSTFGGGGSVLASQWNVASGVGTHLVPVANSYRASYLPSVSVNTIDVTITVSLSFTNVTGGNIEPAIIMLRGKSITEYYMVKVLIDTAEAISMSIVHYNGTTIVASTSTGLTHSSSQSLRVRASIEGSTLRGKVWPASGLEPYDWHVVGYSNITTGYGWVGVRSGAATGNTNVPVTFSYDNLVVAYPRFHGEITSLTPSWDTSGNDVIATVEAGSVLARIGQGNSPIGSSMRRGLTRGSTGIAAYWPCEDDQNATRISAGMPGVLPMDIVGTGTTFATNSDFICSDPLPTPGTALWLGTVPPHTVAGIVQSRFLLSVPSGGVSVDTTLFSAFLTGTAYRINVDVNSAGSLRVAAYNLSDTLISASAFTGFAVNGSPRWVSLEYSQSGGNILVNLVTLEPGASTGLQLGGGGITFAGTVGVTKFIQVPPMGTSVAIGHISVHSIWSSLFNLGRQLASWDGELAADRIARLCSEEDIALVLVGDASDSPQMGPMSSSTLPNILYECADMDLGTLSEAVGDGAMWYRTLASTYNQDAGLTLDYSLGQVAAPLEPLTGIQLLRNDITVKRSGGGESRAELTTGRLSTLAPQDGGAGRFDTSITVNAYSDDQLDDMASWLLHIGTVDENRYPQITVNLANPNVVSAALENQVMGTDLDDRIVVTNYKSLQSPNDIDQLVRGYTEQISTFQHTLSFVCTPASPYDVVEIDSGIQLLDSDTSTLTNSITNSAASFQVTTTDGSIWSTSSSDWPILITVGGEEMSVGSVSGSSSPQTFNSVTRSVNGIVKAHDAATPVHVTNPAYLALWG